MKTKLPTLGFGTSKLHYLNREDRFSLLEECLNQGITHFDTAPMYGNGLGETAIGAIIPQYGRQNVTIATKVGYPLRSYQRKLPFAAKLYDKVLGKSYHLNYDTSSLTYQFKESLRRLKTSYVDILYLHEPAKCEPDSLAPALQWAAEVLQSGHATAVGLAGVDLQTLKQQASISIDGFILQTEITSLKKLNEIHEFDSYYGFHRCKNKMSSDMYQDLIYEIKAQKKLILFSTIKHANLKSSIQEFQ